MRRTFLRAAVCSLAIMAASSGAPGAEVDAGHGSCVSCTGCGCEPRCKATWGEAKTKKQVLSMKCEYACARARDSWCAPEPECRCHPPCGKPYVKKRLYKSEGQEKVERVPKYEVEMVPAEPCDCAACRGTNHCWWNPFSLFTWLSGR